MRRSSHAQTKSRNRRHDKSVGDHATHGVSTDAYDDLTAKACEIIRAISPVKPAQFLAFNGDISLRQAERILSGRQSIWPAFHTLLGTQYAGRFVWALMESYGSHTFWSGLREQLRIANLKAQRAAIDAELKELGGRQ